MTGCRDVGDTEGVLFTTCKWFSTNAKDFDFYSKNHLTYHQKYVPIRNKQEEKLTI
jgi:hypothetical protein